MYDLMCLIDDDGVPNITPLYPVSKNSNVRSDMNSQDFQDIDSARNQAIAQLAEICAAMGLSWSATEKKFVIDLPTIVIAKSKVVVEYGELPTKRKTFDISTWGEPGPVEGPTTYKSDDPMPDDFQMPDYGEILDEGEAPKGDKDAEK